MRLQRHPRQPDRVEPREDLDRALLTAVEHTEEAQHQLVEEPPGSPVAETLAMELVQRAEDVDILAADARAATEAEMAVDGAGGADDGRRPAEGA